MSECVQRLYPDITCGEPAEPEQNYCAYHLQPDLWDLADERQERQLIQMDTWGFDD